MKRKVSIIISIMLLLLIFTSCEEKPGANATIEEIYDSELPSLLISYEKTQSLAEVSITEEVELVDSNGNKITEDAFKVGDRIIVYCESQLNAYPAILEGCSKIVLLVE